MRRLYRVIDPAGLHARPAADLVRAMAEAVPGPVRIEHGEKAANAKSVLQVLSLGVRQNDRVVVDFGEATPDVVTALEVRMASILFPAADPGGAPPV